MKNGISSQGNCWKRNTAPSPVCQICFSEDEYLEHLLFFCDHARACWSASGVAYIPSKEGFSGFNNGGKEFVY